MCNVGEGPTMVGMTSTVRIDSRRVVIAGAGIAALETVLALRALTGAQTSVTLIAPEPDFTVQLPGNAQPDAQGHLSDLDLGRFMSDHDGHFRRTAVLSIDSESRTVHCVSGPDQPYDSLIIAVGASSRPAFRYALMFGAESPMLGGLLAELQLGYSRSIAFVVQGLDAWSVPLYELALMVADGVSGLSIESVRLHLVTPETAPLEKLGPEATAAAEKLLDAASISLHCNANAVVHNDGQIDTGFAESLEVDRVVALPALSGPRLVGVPADPHGFIPVDEYGRVIGVSDIYAVGDVTDRPLRQCALACLQADTVAAHVAASADGKIDSAPYMPALHGRLFTEVDGRFLRVEKAMNPSEVDTRTLWSPQSPAVGLYLAPYLESRGIVGPALRDERGGVDVDLALAVH
jgi:sulfide:quinone oxidoreductase